MSNDLVEINQAPQDMIPPEILSKVILTGNLACLDEFETVIYINAYCKSLGLNVLTRPFDIIEDDKGKKILYARKEATEQLRKIHKVSIKNVTKEMVGDNIYVITVYVCTPDGREDAATGAVSLAGKAGDKLANALMKAESKAKRRATLSICGLGIPDESDIESFAENRYQQSYSPQTMPASKANLERIEQSSTTKDLQDAYVEMYSDARGNKPLQAEILKAKNKRKEELDAQNGVFTPPHPMETVPEHRHIINQETE